MIRALTAALLLVVVLGGAAVFLVARPGQEVASASDPDVTITCQGATGVDAERCQAWGDEILALGAPSTTFELEDVDRLNLSRPLFGFGSPCQVEYFLGRYPDEAVWIDDVDCAS